MDKEQFDNRLAEAAKKFSDKKTPKRPETQFKAGAMWLWELLMDAKDIPYYEQRLRDEITDRIGGVEPWQESLITDTAVMMVDRDEIAAEIKKEGRLLTKWDKQGNPYQESNPLYVHLKEKERSIGMQREHLGLSFKVNPTRMKESPKKGSDAEKDGLSNLLTEARDNMNEVPEL